MLLKEYYQSMHGKIDTRIGRAFAPITEVDDEQMIKYKADDGESKEMKASSAKTMPMDHPAKVEYDKLAGGDDGEKKKGVNIFDEPDGPDDGGEGSDDDWDRDPSLEPGDDGRDYAKPGDEDWEDEPDASAEVDREPQDDTIQQQQDYEEWAGQDDNQELRLKMDNDGASYYLSSPERLQYLKDSPDLEAKEMEKWSPEVVAHYKNITEKSEESITPKGSFRKVQEQWVKDNLNVL